MFQVLLSGVLVDIRGVLVAIGSSCKDIDRQPERPTRLLDAQRSPLSSSSSLRLPKVSNYGITRSQFQP
jgi:hypothetical protein